MSVHTRVLRELGIDARRAAATGTLHEAGHHHRLEAERRPTCSSSSTASSGVCIGISATGIRRSASSANRSALKRLSARHAPRRSRSSSKWREQQAEARVDDAEVDAELVEALVEQAGEHRGGACRSVELQPPPPHGPAADPALGPFRRATGRTSRRPGRTCPTSGAASTRRRGRRPPWPARGASAGKNSTVCPSMSITGCASSARSSAAPCSLTTVPLLSRRPPARSRR